MITTRKNLTVLGVVAVSVLAVDGYLRHSAARTSGGKFPLRFETIRHDFGEVNWSKHPQFDFRFTNVSSAPIRINRLVEGCSCIAASVSKETLGPHEAGSVRVRFKPFGYDGNSEQPVSVWLEGHQQPIELRVHAQVNPLLMPAPAQIDLGNVDPASSVSSTLLLRNTTRRKVRVTRVESSARWLQVETTDGDQSASGDPGFTVRLVSPPSGPVRERITVHTDVPERSPLQIPVQAEVPSKWRRSASELFFGFVNVGNQLQRTLVIDGLDPSMVRRTWSEGTGATVNLSYRSQPPQAVLTASLDLRSAKPGEIAGSVFIETNDPAERLVRIPLTGMVQDPHSSLCCPRPEAKP